MYKTQVIEAQGIRRGANVNVMNEKHDMSPMWYACWFENLRLMKLLFLILSLI